MKLPNSKRALVRAALAAACGVAAVISATTARAQSENAAENAAESPDERADGSSETDGDTPSSEGTSLLTAQTFWTRDKVMPGVAFGARLGVVELDLEASLLWLTEPAPPRGITHLGSELGAHVMFLTLRERYIDLALGVGGDFYWLWSVHGDALEAALAFKSAAHVWVTPELGLYATARAYPITTSGLELGTTRSGDDGLPVLFTTGITWRL